MKNKKDTKVELEKIGAWGTTSDSTTLTSTADWTTHTYPDYSNSGGAGINIGGGGFTYSPSIDLGVLVPSCIEFKDKDGEVVGKLDFSKGTLEFSGNIRKSARNFLEFLKPSIDEYIKTAAFKNYLDENLKEENG